jgi:ABC-2 type transport system ATP-binding protein
MSSALSVSKLYKKYGQFEAVKGISFELPKGSILGLLGPNGAGKTTVIQMLLGLTTPDAGTITYFGDEFSAHREKILQRINFASTYSELQGKITVYENLYIHAGFYQVNNPRSKIMELLELFEISHLANTTFWKLSSGQRTRAILAKSLINDPDLLLMDEPTASLDPEIIVKMIGIIKSLQEKKGVSVLYTSHNMEEVARLCDEIIFLQNGSIVAKDTPQNLTKMVDQTTVTITFATTAAAQKVKAHLTSTEQKFPPTLTTNPTGTQLMCKVLESEVPTVLSLVHTLAIPFTHLSLKEPNLEDVFLHIAERQRREHSSY